MKKYLLLIIVLVLCNVCSGQLGINCGTWKADTTYSSWQTIDTIGKKKVLTTARNWVYNNEDEPLESNMQMTLAYCPCGCPYTFNYWQYRVCKITGIMQKRLKSEYSYMIPPDPKPKTEYENIVDSLDALKK